MRTFTFLGQPSRSLALGVVSPRLREMPVAMALALLTFERRFQYVRQTCSAVILKCRQTPLPGPLQLMVFGAERKSALLGPKVVSFTSLL